MSQNYLTISQLITAFGVHHQEVRRVKISFVEQLANFSTEGNQEFPILYAQPLDILQGGFSDVYSFRVYCVDLLQKDRSNEGTVLNSTSSILRDLTNWLREDTTNGIPELLNDPRAIPVNNFLMDFTAGWYIDVEFDAQAITSECSIPFASQMQFSGTSCDIRAISPWLTCETLSFCPSYINISNNSTTSNDGRFGYLSASTLYSNQLSGGTISAGSAIYSAGTDLSLIFQSKGESQSTFISPTQIAFGNSTSGITGSTSLTFNDSILTTSSISANTIYSAGTEVSNLFARTVHTHPISQVDLLQSSLNTKANLSGASFTGIISSGGTDLSNLFSPIGASGTDYGPILATKANLSGATFTGTINATSIITSAFKVGNIQYFAGDLFYGGAGQQSYLQISAGQAQIGHFNNRTQWINNVGNISYANNVEVQRQTTTLTTINTNALINGLTRSTSLSATTLSASTYYSGSTPLETIFRNFSPFLRTEQIAFGGSGSGITGSTKFVWNNANSNLGIYGTDANSSAAPGLGVVNDQGKSLVMYVQPSGKSGTWSGTSINLSGVSYVDSGVNGTNDLVIAGSKIYNLPGSTSSNYGTKLDLNGFRVDALSALQTTNTILFKAGALSSDQSVIYSGGTPFQNIFATGSIASGTYTPTAVAVTNITAVIIVNDAMYTRVNNIVTVSGAIKIQNTLAVASQVDITLPIASNLGSITDLNGVATMDSTASMNIYINGDTTNDRASIFFTSAGVGQTSVIYYQFTYKVI